MRFVHIFFILSLVSAFIGCLVHNPSQSIGAGDKVCENRAHSMALEKWGWGRDTVFGIPTIELKRMDNLMIPDMAYRVTVANKDFAFGSGPRTITSTCVIRGQQVIFLETDDDVAEFMSPVEESSVNIATVLKYFDTFARLRGLELQVGMPTSMVPWVVSHARDNHLLKIFELSDSAPHQWQIIIDKNSDGWCISGTLVSPSSFRSNRYEMTITTKGLIRVRNVGVVFQIDYI